MHMCVLSHVPLFCNPWTVVHEAPLFMGFSKQEYWSGSPFPALGDLPDPGIKPLLCVSCTGRQFLYHCASWDAQYFHFMLC